MEGVSNCSWILENKSSNIVGVAAFKSLLHYSIVPSITDNSILGVLLIRNNDPFGIQKVATGLIVLSFMILLLRSL